MQKLFGHLGDHSNLTIYQFKDLTAKIERIGTC